MSTPEVLATPPETGRGTTITSILVSVFLLGGGSALQGTALALRASLEGFSDPMIGVISSSYYAGVLAGSFLALLVIRSVGYVRAFAAFASLGSASAIAHILWINPGAWVVLRLIHGISFSVVLVVVESWLNVIAPSARRGQILSLYSIVYLASVGVAQPLIGVFSPAGFELFAITSILVSLCLLPITLANVSGVVTVASVRIRMMGIFRKSPTGVAGVLVSGLVAGAHLSLAPRFAQTLGLPDRSIGLFMLVFSLGTIALQWPLGIISDTMGRRRALGISAVAGAAAGVGLSLARGAGPWMTVTAFLFGGFALPLYSLSIAAVNDQLLPEDMVQSSGALYVFYGFGSMVGPLLAAVAMDRRGVVALYWVIAAILALYALFLVFRVSASPEFTVRGTTESYRSYPRTTMVALQMLQRMVPRRGRGDARRGDTRRGNPGHGAASPGGSGTGRSGGDAAPPDPTEPTSSPPHAPGL